VTDRRRACEALVGGASVLVFLSSFAHAWPGWAALRRALPATTDPAVLATIRIGWRFGSVAMATFGLLGLLAAVRMSRGDANARWTPVLIGAAYVLFGAGALLNGGSRLHFGTFLALGGLLLAGGLAWRPDGTDPADGVSATGG
jgi:hypothetical protein